MDTDITIIKIRKGITGFRYSICTEKGNWIGDATRISEISSCYDWGIKHGLVKLVRELKSYPENKDIIESITNEERSCGASI